MGITSRLFSNVFAPREAISYFETVIPVINSYGLRSLTGDGFDARNDGSDSNDP